LVKARSFLPGGALLADRWPLSAAWAFRPMPGAL